MAIVTSTFDGRSRRRQRAASTDPARAWLRRSSVRCHVSHKAVGGAEDDGRRKASPDSAEPLPADPIPATGGAATIRRMTAPVAPLPVEPEHLLPGSVDTYLVTDVPLCGPDMTVADLQAMLVGRRYESAADVAVCTSDDGAAATGCWG